MAGETGRKSNGIGGEGIEGDKQEGRGSSKRKKKAKLSKERVMYIPISADKDKGRHTGSDIKREKPENNVAAEEREAAGKSAEERERRRDREGG